MSTPELCRKHGISDATFYKWRAKYSGMEVNEVKKPRQLEDENRKQMVTEQALDILALKEERTHSTIDDLTPMEFIRNHQQMPQASQESTSLTLV